MATTRFTDHTGTGTAAARPAAGDVPQGFIYFASDTLVVSKSDGISTWTTLLTADAGLSAHLADASDAHDASAISADSTTLVGTGADVQAVLEELDNGIADHLADASDAHDASAISFSPTGSIAATDVQAAIAEVASEATGGSADGWTSLAGTFTHSASDAPTYVLSTPSDLTAVIPVGSRFKCTHGAAVKYFIVTAIDSTTITLYGGTDYTLSASAITLPSYSMVKAPLGFPLDPAKWTVEVTDTSSRTQASPVNNTWYNLGTINIVVPIGCWRLMYEVNMEIDNSGTDNALLAYSTLSTANNTESDKKFTGFIYTAAGSQAGLGAAGFVHRENFVTLAAKSTRYLNAMSQSGGSNIYFTNNVSTCVVRAVCAYL